MRFGTSPLLLLLFCSFLSCSRQPQLADSAVATDFDGRWSGTWNWSVTNLTFVEISGTRAKVAGLPILQNPVAGTLVVVSTEGTATFENAYGAKGAPCVLLSFPGIQEVVAVFLGKDREHLTYTVSENRRWRIVFTRSTP